ncbi:hypothetical protein FHR81_004326 [Actinoalloteichus hoggarensis]|uniref:VanZ like family protein n=1 Tax=Actinoalloteichus hoggarensis TaxID=1470176 RepID=A0A221W9G6_9PSEU|nr:VanZ family protein [Actinoalloteichus hoggarensis]ASO22321.1 VanZ like family protein [Actinoalloteichus hoggarensis]MBB5923259.1 hypothetical protein [Actinoalloteichus hoggarensis]
MISTFLVTYPWLTTTALMLLIVVGPLAGAWLADRPRATRVLLGLSIAAVLVLTFAPASRELEIGCSVEWDLPRLGAVELMANVILFVPVVLLAGVLTRRPILMVAVASGASVLIELVQAFATVFGRSCSTNDWLANTLGALLGAVLAVAALWLARSFQARIRR